MVFNPNRWLPDEALFSAEAYQSICRCFDFAREQQALDERTQIVLQLLSEMRSDAPLINAGLLVPYWRKHTDKTEALLTRLKDLAGAEALAILQALDTLGLIDQLHEQKNDLEALRKMLLAMANDMRAVILKLALQTSLMRTMETLDLATQQRYAMQTRDIFAPLANRLGIAQLKSELEDRALQVLEPDIYQEIAHELEGNRADRELYIKDIIAQLQEALQQYPITVHRIYGRVKHINSIYLKMKRKGLKFEQLNDIRAIRIETETEAECYQALAVVDSLWRPIPSEFDDYIQTPKANGYQSLHSSFIGPEGRVLEVQIRTRAMHEHAELGVAAHWIYKEKGVRHSKQFEQQIEWLRRMISGGDKNRGDVVFDQFKNEAFKDRVYAVSPQGRVVDLPEGGTPLDFAYHIHTQLGHRCRGAKVNGQMVPLTTALKNGDSVEILTQKEANPSRDWLNDHLGYLQSGRAKAKVRSYFKKLEKESSMIAGQEMLERECKRLSIEITGLEALLQRFNLHSVQDLYASIGFGDIGVLTVAHEIEARQPKNQALPSLDERVARLPIRNQARHRPQKQSVVVDGLDDVLVNFASCCQPVPPNEIKGFLTLGRGVNVHRADCHNVLHLAQAHPERMMDVYWHGSASGVFRVDIMLEAFDSAYVLRDISQILSNEKIPITAVDMKQNKENRILFGTFSLEISDMEQLSRALHRIELMKDVHHVRRVQH